MKYTYLISEKYCENWTIQSAIREVIANAIDTTSEPIFSWASGKGTIANIGCFIETSHLLLGESTKRETQDAIGQFGEGFKIAALVFVRQNRKFSIRTKKNNFVFFMQFSEDFNCNILGVDVQECENQIDGTYVGFECTEEEFNSAKNLFMKFNPAPKLSENILDASGRIYILGVQVLDNFNSLFGYNINHKTLINRDRTILDTSALNREITNILASCKDEGILEKLITSGKEHSGMAEYANSLYVSWSVKPIWRELLEKLYGKKIAIATNNPTFDHRAKYLGYKVVDCGSTINDTLKYSFDIKKTSEIEIDKVTKYIPFHNLSDDEKVCLTKCLTNFDKFFDGHHWDNVHFTEELAEDTEAQRHKDTIFLNRKHSTDYDKVMELLIHESAHITSNTGDMMEGFEEELLNYAMTVVRKCENIMNVFEK
jgi:hypothetical protein